MIYRDNDIHYLENLVKEQDQKLQQKENIIKGLDNTIENLEKVVEHKDNIIKEVREYLKLREDDNSMCSVCGVMSDRILEILDKENKDEFR